MNEEKGKNEKEKMKIKTGVKTRTKSQAAMEYLMTYGWAILIIALVVGVLYSLGVFNPSSPSYCVFSGEVFLCQSFSIDSEGYLSLTLTSNHPNRINVTQIACNAWGNLSYAYTIPGGVILYPSSTYS
ncbi:MAG: hypothetical protein ACPLXS_03650, partial [Candidatus Micrarchaeales archaeon]